MNARRDLEDVVIRSNDAKQVLEEPFIKQSFAAIEAELYARFQKTPPSEVQRLQEIRLEYHGLDLLRKQLTAPIREGTIATNRLKEMSYKLQMERT